MRIKEVAKKTGLTEKTIRYYEACGLAVPDMEMKDHRLWRDYTAEHVRLLTAIATLRRASFRVEEISLLLSSPEKIPETVEKVRERAETARAEAEKLCERLAQPDLREAGDVLTLAQRLEDTAAAFSLPPADRSFRTRGMDRCYREARSLSASLAVRIGVLVCVLWLLAMGLLSCVYARDLDRQAARLSEDALEAFLEKPEDTVPASLPALCFRPAEGFPARSGPEFPLLKAALVLDGRGIVTENAGFEDALPAAELTTEQGLGVLKGRLCLMYAPNQWIRDNRKAKSARSYLAFRDAPQLGVSFPSREIAGDYPDDEGKYGVGVPVRGGSYEEGAVPSPGVFLPEETEFRPPLELLDGIESGALRFDADGVLQGSRLRGVWQRDGEGRPVRFLLAAYGWSPLAMALRLLTGAYLAGLAVFLLFGLLLWLRLRRSLLRPLKELNGALEESLLEVSPQEFDYAFPYRELRELAALSLLRRQMLAARPSSAPEGPADLRQALTSARRKLLPLMDARMMEPSADFRAEGAVAAAPEALEDALLALIREALPYGEQGEKLTLRTLKREGFLLAEAEFRTKWKLRVGIYGALWEGVYRLPGGGDAPGAKLRKASAAIPGSFCAVRKTRRGLCLTLGLPAAE